MNRSWTKKQEAKLTKLYPTIDNPRQLVEMIGRPYSAIRAKASSLRLKRNFHVGAWPPARERKLISLYPTTTVAELAPLLGVTGSAVMARAFVLGLRKDPAFHRQCSAKGWFSKGQEPFNKGRRQKEYMSPAIIKRTKATRFKKGQAPVNYRPVGSERLSKDGYVEIKIADPKKWDLKHRVIWHKHYGKIPKGQIVKFRDGNKTNFDLDNLYLSTRVENMQANSYHNYPKEIENLIQLRGALTRQINKHA